MKFKLVNIGPIKEANIELGDFTLFLGLPSTGKSFALRSIYTSLVLLSRKYEKFFEQKFYEMLAKASITGTDRLISYLQNNTCNPKAIESLIPNIRVEVGDECEIRVYEDISNTLKEFLSMIKNGIKEDYLKLLRKSLNYNDSSAIYINGKEIMEQVEGLDIKELKGEIGNAKFELSSNGILQVKFKPGSRLTSVSSSLISIGVKRYFDSVGINEDAIFIPSARSEIELVNETNMEYSVFLTDLGEMFALDSCYPIAGLDLSVQQYILHFNNAKEKLPNGHVLDLLKAITGLSVENGKIVFKEKWGEIRPSHASVTIKEIVRILLPLADVQTPALVFIEEPEAYLHPTYQILLLLVLLSLVQHGYKFVIETHSDLLVSFLSVMSKEGVDELLKRIFGYEPLPAYVLKEAEKTLKGIKAYQFEKGTAKEIPANELAYNSPGKQVMGNIVMFELKGGREDQ